MYFSTWVSLAAVALAAFLSFRYCALQVQNADLQQQLQVLGDEARACQAINSSMRQSIAVLRDPATIPFTAGDEKTHSLVFVNAFRCEVLLDIGGLPAPDAGRHLQMWAKVGDQYHSMGMVNMQAAAGLQQFPCVAAASGYLVSSETQAGGNSFPSRVLLNTQ